MFKRQCEDYYLHIVIFVAQLQLLSVYCHFMRKVSLRIIMITTSWFVAGKWLALATVKAAICRIETLSEDAAGVYLRIKAPGSIVTTLNCPQLAV